MTDPRPCPCPCPCPPGGHKGRPYDSLPHPRPRPSAPGGHKGRRYLALALLALAACRADPPPPTSQPGRGLPRVPTADVIGLPALSAQPTSPAAGDETPTGPRIAHEPATLQVYRSTPMRLWLEPPPADPAVTCRWSFGGGATQNDAPSACAIEHTFIGGTADERVSLTITDADGSKTLTRIIPLERLPISTRPVEAAATPGDWPEKPNGSEDFRMVLLADTDGADAARLAAIARRVVDLEADLVVHLGAHADDGEGWTRQREALLEGLRAADIPLLPAISPGDLAAGPEVRRPLGPDGEPLPLLVADAFPERWVMSYRGVLMLFVSGAEQSPEALAWLRDRLTDGQVYESRLVFSYLPLHPFGEHRPDVPDAAAGATLGPKFKVYELLLRARTTALFSAGHAVYYKGRYGALSVVSVGSAAVSGQRLLGADLAQPASIAVVDVVRGVPERVFALADGPPGSDVEPLSVLIDDAFLPPTVEVYTQ